MPAAPGGQRRRYVTIALLLGLLVPGLGQGYGGDLQRAVLWFLGALGLGTLAIRACFEGSSRPSTSSSPSSSC